MFLTYASSRWFLTVKFSKDNIHKIQSLACTVSNYYCVGYFVYFSKEQKVDFGVQHEFLQIMCFRNVNLFTKQETNQEVKIILI